MFNSFSTALSALTADGAAVDAVGNNLANLNTTGYKATTVTFEDMVAESMGLGGTANAPGLGVAAPIIQRQFTQGSIQTTGGTLDAAIQGDGFFMVRGSSGQVAYTRAGTFSLDNNGNLVNANGDVVQGWMSVNGAAVNGSGTPVDINIPNASLAAPVATTKMTIQANLDAGANAGASSGSFSTSIQVFDSLGEAHNLTVTFTKSGANAWNYAFSIPGADMKSGTSGTPFPISGATGSLAFNSSGQLTSPAASASPVKLTISGLADGAATLNVNWNLYNPDGSGALTQYAQASAVSATSQDGQVTAQVTKVAMSDGGQVTATFSNGQQLVIAQLALASIHNPQSLQAIGNNEFALTGRTAAPVVGMPGTGGRGTIVGGALEGSTADMATEFTNLIVYQRSYEAAAKVITATDELTQQTVALIR